MSLMKPPGWEMVIGDNHFHWTEPDEERKSFDARTRALMNMSGDEFLLKLDRGEFAHLLEEEDDLNLSYLVALSDLGR